jgi:hypothetical protein
LDHPLHALAAALDQGSLEGSALSRKETGPAPRELIVAIARGFKLTMPEAASVRSQWMRDIAVVAGILKTFNATFDRALFFEQCGVEDHIKKGEVK